MNDITNRLLEVYQELKKADIVTGQADFAHKIGISPSTFTEISKGRSNAGLNVIQGTVEKFPMVNIDWLLLGKGKMLVKKYNTPDDDPVDNGLKEPEFHYTPTAKMANVSPNQGKNVSPTVSPTHVNCQICFEKERLIEQQKETIKALSSLNDMLIKRVEDLEGNQKKNAV